MNNRNSKAYGYLFGVVAAAAFGLNPVFAVPLMHDGMDAVSVLFFRYLIAIPMVYALMRSRGRIANIGLMRILSACGMGLLMALSSVTLFESYLYMEVGIASTLLFVYPLIVAVIMTLFFHEVMVLSTFVSLIGALFGVWLLCSSPSNGHFSLPGVGLVMGSAISYACYIVGVNRPPLRNVATLSLTFWVLVSGSIFLALIVVAQRHLAVPHTAGMWTNLVLLAALPTLLSLLCTNYAIEKIGSTATAILGVFEPITAVIAGALMFGESMNAKELSGLFLVLLCVALVIGRGTLMRQVLSIRMLFPIAKKHKLGKHHRSRGVQ